MRAANKLPLSALVSQALVAFTIEFDNEFEHQMPHRTTNHGASAGGRGGPWLVSLAMWSNCMQFVGDDGVRVRDLAGRARTETNLKGMERWGYVAIKPEAGDGSKKSPRSQWMIRATSKGRQAQEVWRPLFGVIEKRWQARFGEREIESLRESLAAVTSQIGLDLPDCLPILGYGLSNKPPAEKKDASSASKKFERRAAGSAGAAVPRAARVRTGVRARVRNIARDRSERASNSRRERRASPGSSGVERSIEGSDQRRVGLLAKKETHHRSRRSDGHPHKSD